MHILSTKTCLFVFKGLKQFWNYSFHTHPCTIINSKYCLLFERKLFCFGQAAANFVLSLNSDVVFFVLFFYFLFVIYGSPAVLYVFILILSNLTSTVFVVFLYSTVSHFRNKSWFRWSFFTFDISVSNCTLSPSWFTLNKSKITESSKGEKAYNWDLKNYAH